MPCWLHLHVRNHAHPCVGYSASEIHTEGMHHVLGLGCDLHGSGAISYCQLGAQMQCDVAVGKTRCSGLPVGRKKAGTMRSCNTLLYT